MLLVTTDLVDEDPTLLAVCNFENDPIGFTGDTTLLVAAAAAAVVPAKIASNSVEGVFSPNSQYVVTLPLP